MWYTTGRINADRGSAIPIGPTVKGVPQMSSNSTIDSNKYHGKPCKNCDGTLRYKRNGKIGECVKCAIDRAQKRRDANPGEAGEKWKEWHKQNPGRKKEQDRQWGKNNPDKIKANNRRYRQNNSDRERKRKQQWRKNNPGKASAIWHRRRALKRNAKSEPYDFEAICNHYGNCCIKCGRDDVKLTVDHIKPLSTGGDDVSSNIQPLCHSCNATKHTKHIDYRPDSGLLHWIQKRLF